MGQSVMVRLKEEERVALMYAADARSTTPANWVRSLAIVHLARRPQWTPDEIDAMRDIFTELREDREQREPDRAGDERCCAFGRVSAQSGRGR